MVTDLILLGCITYLGNIYLSFKFNNKKAFTIFGITYLCIFILNGDTVQPFTSLMILILFYLYMFIQFKGDWKNILKITTFYVFILAFMEYNLNIHTNTFYTLTTQLNKTRFNNLIIFTIINYISYFATKKTAMKIDEKTSVDSFIFIPFIVIPIVFYGFISTIYKFENLHLYFTLLINALIIINFCISYETIKEMNLKKQIRKLVNKEKYSQTKYDLLDQQYKNSFKLLHDILGTSQNLSMLLKDEEYQKAYEELHTLTELTFKEFNSMYTNSLILNTLLSDRVELLNKNHINVTSTIEYNDFNFIDFCDQIDLFGHILDYAIQNAIKSMNHKNIIIKSKLIADKIVIQFQFPKVDDKNIESEIKSFISPIIFKYKAHLSISEMDENRISLVIAFNNLK